MGSSQKNKNHQKTAKRKIVFLFFGILISLSITLVVTFDYRSASDRNKVSEFKPSNEVETLTSKMNLTDKGKTILYASSPQLKDKTTFNGICGHDGDPNTYIAGCYYTINDEEYIDIYDSGKDASELQNSFYDYTSSKVVTLAHEMMHAVYSRVSDKDKEWIQTELNKIYSSNSILHSELSSYSNSERYSELYARTATEIYGLPHNLESHYSQFFKDRQYIVKLYYDNKEQLDSMFHGADELLRSLEKQESIIKNSSNYYEKINAIDEYNRLVDLYNSQIGVYRDTIAKMDSEK